MKKRVVFHSYVTDYQRVKTMKSRQQVPWCLQPRSRIISLQQIFFGAGQGPRNKTVDYDQVGIDLRSR